MWRRIVRYVISPLAGLVILGHEVFFIPAPREWAVIAALVLLGVPVDSAARLLGRSSEPDDSSPTTRSNSSSSSEGHRGG